MTMYSWKEHHTKLIPGENIHLWNYFSVAHPVVKNLGACSDEYYIYIKRLLGLNTTKLSKFDLKKQHELLLSSNLIAVKNYLHKALSVSLLHSCLPVVYSALWLCCTPVLSSLLWSVQKYLNNWWWIAILYVHGTKITVFKMTYV